MARAEAESDPVGKTSSGPPRRGPLQSLLNRILGALNAVGTIWIFLLMVLINLDVGGRGLLNSPVPGVNEMIELSIVGIVFLQLGDATRAGRLTRSDGLFTIVLKRRPAVGRLMGLAFDLIGACFMALILYGSWPLFWSALEDNEYVGTIGVFTAPVWPVQLIILIGCAVTLLQFLAFAWRYWVAQDLLAVEAHTPGEPE